eukprot:TRINITY_DN1474_c0_g1_i1.p1 TRINITY_DN1474_c0_g1~~TRINITY_DN1474_c0_g1_i1.p1  ORF type:complete len:980 (-),score=217.99 TRINITY_DN1474_c0_g1_i1:23-2962(-)
MIQRQTIVLLLLLFCFLTQGFLVGRKSGFNSVVSSLSDFQNSNGGFQLTKSDPPSLEATSYALFLSSLFGSRDKINQGAVIPFIESLKRSDSGYANTQEQTTSDLISTKYALLSYHHAGEVATPKSSALSSFIQQLYDSKSKFFVPKAGAKGDIKATALALQCLQLLNDDRTGASLKNEIKANLEKFKKDYSFDFKDGRSATSDNYYGIVVGKFVGIDFDANSDRWAQYFVSKQVLHGKNKGGFYADDKNTEVTLESTWHAVAALVELPGNHIDKIDLKSLNDYVSNIPHNLRDAAYAYLAIANTKAFEKLFNIETSYEVLSNRPGIVGDRVIQGTQLKPVITVKSLLGTAHAGLDISLTIYQGGSSESQKLQWNQETQQYVAPEFYLTEGKLGNLTFAYHIKHFVVDLGLEKSLSIEKTDVKTIGYAITVTSEATLAGKIIEADQVVGFGTNFQFSVELGTFSSTNLLSGDFDLIFSVLDSSGIPIYSETQDGRTNKAPFHFKYSLTPSNIPSGNLGFRFDVKNAKGVHTSHYISYKLDIKMIATDIVFENVATGRTPEYKIGDQVIVKLTPAAFPDLSTVRTFDPKTLSERSFYMDVSSPISRLHSIKGSPIDGTSSYRFVLPISSTFESIGTNIVTFRYQTSTEEDILLSPFDPNGAYDDSEELKFVVNAELNVVNFNHNIPKEKLVLYGTHLDLRFKIKDTVSNQFIWSGALSNVSLSLKYDNASRAIKSTLLKSAELVYEKAALKEFRIVWNVDANAHKGSGNLELVAHGADNRAIPLYKGEVKEKTLFSIPIIVGGDITSETRVYEVTVESPDKVVLVVPFRLSCQNKTLPDAYLQAILFNTDAAEVEIARVPVARFTDAQYQASWAIPRSEIKSGKYAVKVFRDVDLQRAAEYAAIKRQQQAAQKRKGEKETTVPDFNLEPLLTLELYLHPDSFSQLPVRTEFLVVVLLLLGFVGISFKKAQIEAPKKKKKN